MNPLSVFSRKALLLPLLACGITISSCRRYLDIVPDNIPTIDNAFKLRQEAEKYLATCYSYIPGEANFGTNPALGSGDEVWLSLSFRSVSASAINIAMGNQNSSNPYMAYWSQLYQGIRDCNIFLDNVDNVADLEPYMKQRWVAEVKFLKAYYHWYLLRMYGPVPVVDKNLPITASIEEVKVFRQPVDSVVNYCAALMDEAAKNLPMKITNTIDELGRVTVPVALSVKARMLVTAASPLFNGNTDYTNFKNRNGAALVSTTYDAAKWQRAATACKQAIDTCQAAGISLYHFNEVGTALSPTLKVQMDIRNAVCGKWNQELIWGASNSAAGVYEQRLACPRLDPSRSGNNDPLGVMAPTLKVAEQFYTKNGVPVNEDKTWDYAGRYKVTAVPAADGEIMMAGYPTAALNIGREPRYYADIAFDGARWFMQSNTWNVMARWGMPQSQKGTEYSLTGMFAKKIASWKYVINEGQSSSTEPYPWPMFRLADLYLLYAEALNEAGNTPSAEAYQYINLVRERAGIAPVQDAWTNFSRTPLKYTTKTGFRDIIQQERLIELAFEGSRYWDLLRWKRASVEMNKTITGWNLPEADPAKYYLPVVLFNQTFELRNYLWPLADQDILVNPNLVQNPGW